MNEMKKYKMPCGCILETNDIVNCKERYCRHGYMYETGFKDRTLSLKAVVLNKLAKEYAKKDWNDMSNWFKNCGMPALVSYVEEGVELALAAKQVECKRFMDEANEIILRKNKKIMELEKRLLAKSEKKVLNNLKE